MRTLTLVPMLCLVAALTACGSLPPLWPLSEAPTDPPGYPTAAAPQSCATSSQDAMQNLYCVQKDALDTARRFAAEQRTLEAVKNGEVIALFGLGTAAGVQTVATSSTIPVKNIGLAAVSLLGLSTALGVDGQRTAYEAGATAMACLIQLDAALDTAKPLASNTAAPKATLTTLGVTGSAEALASIQHQLMTAVAQVGLPAAAENAPRAAASAQAAQAFTLTAASLATTAVARAQIAQDRDAELRQAVAQATDTKTRTAALWKALTAIKTSVADQLYKNIDVTQIFDTAKKGYQNLAGNVANAQNASKKASNDAGGVNAATLKALASANTNLKDLANVQPLVEQMTNNANAAQPVADTYDSCVGKATPNANPPAK